MTRTPMSTITRPTTRIAYRATAVTVPLNRLPSGSPASAPGASPDASCHGPVGAPPLSFFFERGSALTDASLAVLTTDHPPAAVLDVARAVRPGSRSSARAPGWGVAPTAAAQTPVAASPGVRRAEPRVAPRRRTPGR